MESEHRRIQWVYDNAVAEALRIRNEALYKLHAEVEDIEEVES